MADRAEPGRSHDRARSPIAPLAIGWVYQRRPLTAPAVVLAGSAVAAAALAVATRLYGSPATLAVAAPVLAMLVLTRVPVVRDRRLTAVLFLTLGWLGGAASLVIVDPRIATQARAALSGKVLGGPLNDRDAGCADAGRDGARRRGGGRRTASGTNRAH